MEKKKKYNFVFPILGVGIGIVFGLTYSSITYFVAWTIIGLILGYLID